MNTIIEPLDILIKRLEEANPDIESMSFRENRLELLSIDESKRVKKQLEDFEIQFEMRFPDSFKELVQKYNFNNFALSSVYFPFRNGYLKNLIDMNTDGIESWCDDEPRPKDQFYIADAADSSGHIVLYCNTGWFYYVEYINPLRNRTVICKKEFELLLRAFITADLEMLSYRDKFVENLDHYLIMQSRADQVAEYLGSSEEGKLFWRVRFGLYHLIDFDEMLEIRDQADEERERLFKEKLNSITANLPNLIGKGNI
jgi:hypothetical protein